MAHEIEHGSITEDDGIHEPKGVSTATVDQVYVADGALSGAWAKLEGTKVASTGETGAIKYLREDGDDTSSWQAAVAEGTAILSTGETGASKFLREDGDNSSSWQLVNAAAIDTTTVADKAILVADGAGACAWQEYPFGGVTYENRTTGTQITGSGGTSDIKVSDILVAECSVTNASSEFTGAGPTTYNPQGELVYTGTLARHFHIVCQASVDLATAATNNVVASIYKYDAIATTWARVAGSDGIATVDNTNVDFIATHCDITLNTNDRIVMALQNIGGTADVRLYTYYLFAIGMPGT